MNEALANKIRALPVYNHRSGQRLVSLADVLGIITDPEPEIEPAAPAPSAEAAAQELSDEPQSHKVARRRAETGDR